MDKQLNASIMVARHNKKVHLWQTERATSRDMVEQAG